MAGRGGGARGFKSLSEVFCCWKFEKSYWPAFLGTLKPPSRIPGPTTLMTIYIHRTTSCQMGQCEKLARFIITLLSQYFINVCQTLIEFMLDPEINSMFLNPTTDEEILKITLNLKDGSQGWDNLLPKIMKVTKSSWITPLTMIINQSLIDGTVPDKLKMAKVIPLFKNDNPSYFNNYRPISVLPFFSNFVEKVVYSRIYNFLTKHCFFYMTINMGFAKITLLLQLWLH